MGKNNNSRVRRSKAANRVKTSPVPSHYITRMCYYDTGNLTEPVAAAGIFRTYCLNSLYDPDVTGVGNQPVTYDQWSAMYNRFRVSMVEVQLVFTNASGGTIANVGYIASPLSVLPASSNSWACQRISEFSTLEVQAGGGAQKTFSLSLKPWDVLGLTRAQYYDEADYSHSAGAGPLRPVYFHIWIQGIIAGASVHYTTRLRYHAEVAEPNTLTIS